MKVKEFCAIEMTSYTNFKGTYYIVCFRKK